MRHVDAIGGMFIVSALLFVLGEGWALFNKTAGDTLSERVWAWLRGRRKRNVRVPALYGDKYNTVPADPIVWNHNTWRTWVVGAFLLWLFFHLTFGWFSG
jgi:hypothetical protein